MTDIQILHHTEQMEALRADFMRLWQSRILPTLSRRTPRRRAEIMQIEWDNYKAHDQRKRQTCCEG